MKNKTAYIKVILGCCLAFCAIQANAQGVLTFKYVPGNPIRFVMNDCLEYYNLPDSTSPVFKSVTETHWFSPDSNIKHKRFTSKTKTKFNKMGQTLFSVTKDSVGVSDSERYVYDAAYNEIREIEYSRNDSSGMMSKAYEEIWVYDAKYNAIKDSSFDAGNGRPGDRHRYYRDYEGEGEGDYDGDGRVGNPEIKVSYCKYDTAGNQLEDISIRIGSTYNDTNIVHQKYDDHNRQVYKEDYTKGYGDRLYTTYDEKGNETSTIDSLSSGYIAANYYTYNDKGMETSHRELTDSKQTRYITRQYNFDGTQIQ
ncbi:MAG TPA: hypothetical protein VNY36_07955, partial [Bacteroidia bacterium]|nr:hypothetical protein [Bacteroidia bacterium]